MDFKSPKGWDPPVGPLSMLDDHSRYAIALDGTWTTHGAPVKERLIAAFEMRHARRDADGSRRAVVERESGGGWTWLTVWLMKQGVELHFTGYAIRRRKAKWSGSTAR